MLESAAIVLIGLVVYVYLGYPIAIGALAALRSRPSRAADVTPTVSVIVAAHDEAEIIEAKVRNFLALDYPEDRVRLVIVSDGSTDGTDERVTALEAPRTTLLRQEPRGGKAAALGAALSEADGEIVVFTDANVMLDARAVRLLVRHFADPEVGVVTGTVHLVDAKAGFAESEQAYYRYERFLQRCESSVGSVVGVDGALYAARRALVDPPPPEVVLDDFVVSMGVARKGHRIIYEPAAEAREGAAPSLAEEFRRKARVAAGAAQALALGLATPGRQPLLWFCFLSHKVLRWLGPWMLVALVAVSAVLAPASAVWAALFWAQVAFGVLAVLGLLIAPLRRVRPMAIPMYFLLMNVAIGWGFFFVKARGPWRRTARGEVPRPTP